MGGASANMVQVSHICAGRLLGDEYSDRSAARLLQAARQPLLPGLGVRAAGHAAAHPLLAPGELPALHRRLLGRRPRADSRQVSR